MDDLRRRLLIIFLFVGLWSVAANAATIDQSRREDGTLISGVTVEGDIEPGDALKLSNSVLTLGGNARTVFLESKGGDVEEAMKMGTLIRRLRLRTEAPTKFEGHEVMNPVLLANKDNNICASACFLVYAGGIKRGGNFIALHRPFLAKETANKISDADYEAFEKKEMENVREYLKSMEVEQFFIDKMMENSSQEAYVVTSMDTVNYHLDRTVPSIEEAVLAAAKCKILSNQEKEILYHKSPEPSDAISQLGASQDCENDVLDDMRMEAFKSELANIVGRPK
jgi:hypothetical protein